MNTSIKTLLALFVFALVSCQSNNDGATMDMASSKMMMAPESEELAESSREMEPSNPPNQTQDVVVKKLIKEGFVEFETYDLDQTRKTVLAAIDKYKGYVATDESYKSPERISYTLTIRVPSENFDGFLADATTGVVQFDSKNINVRDVTEEFLDIEARLKTKKELETRYREILKQAKTVSEILEIEGQLGQLRADIESIEGRLKYLESKVSLATLTMTYYLSTTEVTPFGRKFSEGFDNGWNNLIWFFVIVTNVWPFVLLLIGVILGIRWLRRKK